MNTKISRSKGLTGTIYVPGDKSISHRAVILGCIAEGTTTASNFLFGKDCISTINAFRSMGIKINCKDNIVIIQGKGLYGLKQPKHQIDAGNSGTTTRLLAGLLSGQPFVSKIIGDDSLSKRPMNRVTIPLKQMGASIEFEENKGYLPIIINGCHLNGIEYRLPIASAQVKSCLLLAGLYAQSSVIIEQPVESRDHTELMLKAMGADIKCGKTIELNPPKKLNPLNINIPGDISSAAFLLVAALLVHGSNITIKEVGINPTRTGIIDALQKMGANIIVSNVKTCCGELVGDISASYSQLKSIEVSGSIIPRMIDEIPILALAATQAKGKTVIRDIEDLRNKESDRILAIEKTLKAFGADIISNNNSITISGPCTLHNNKLAMSTDHRMIMTYAIASLLTPDTTLIDNIDWVEISFPGFFKTLQNIQRS